MQKTFCRLLAFILIFCAANLYSSNISGTANGLKFFIYETPDSNIGAINVLVRAGSIFDEKGKYGTAYILSKLLKSGGTNNFSTDSLLNLLDETGTELYTGCSKDFIFLTIKFIKKERKTALNILKEILTAPSFDKKEFSSVKEKTVALITSYQNNNDYVAIHQGAVNLIKNTEYSHSSFGERSDIENISLKDIKSFFKKYFVPENMIITFAGNFKEKQIKDFIKKNFQKTNKSFVLKEKSPKFTNKSKTVFKEKNLKQSYIYILFPSFGLKSENYYPIKLLSFILGGNLTSILAEKIRKEKGLAYSVFSTNYSLVNGGFFLIGLQTENSKADEAIKSIIKILKNLKKQGIDKAKLKLAKNYISGSMLISLQSVNNIASAISQGLFLSKPFPSWEYDIKKLKQVSPESVNAVIDKIFDFNRMIISIVGKKH